MATLANIRIYTQSKALPQLKLRVAEVFIENNTIVATSTAGGRFTLGVIPMENIVVETPSASIEHGCATTNANVFATVIKGVDGIIPDMSDYYNKVEVEERLRSKQGIISDLATIRENASKGATALQSVPSEYVTESELQSKGYATTEQVDAKQNEISDLEAIRSGAAKGATALQQHQQLKTINGKSIVGEGNIEIDGGGGGGTTPIVKITSTNETYIDVESGSQNNFTITPKVCAIDDAGGASGREDGLASAFDVQMHLEPIVDSVDKGTSNIYTKMVEIASGCIYDRSGDIVYALPSASEEFKDNAEDVLATISDVTLISPYIIRSFDLGDFVGLSTAEFEVAQDAEQGGDLSTAIQHNRPIYIHRDKTTLEGLVAITSSSESEDGIYLTIHYGAHYYDIEITGRIATSSMSALPSASESDVYIADFTLADMTATADKLIDFISLRRAMMEGKVILVSSGLNSYMVATTKYMAGVGMNPSKIYITVTDGTTIYNSTAISNPASISSSESTKSTIATTDYVDNKSSDVYVMDIKLSALSNDQDVTFDYASLESAINEGKIILIEDPLGEKMMYMVSASQQGDSIAVRVNNTVAYFWAAAYSNGDGTGTIRASDKMYKKYATEEYVTNVVGDINTLLETIIAG
jgi:hypothetical protein